MVDKPPFLLVHPTKPDGTPTLWKELRELLAFEIASGGQVSIVNRLDRETSGLVLVAKTTAGGAAVWTVDAATANEKGISRDRLGLARLGTRLLSMRRWIDKANMQTIADLAQANDSSRRRAGAD